MKLCNIDETMYMYCMKLATIGNMCWICVHGYVLDIYVFMTIGNMC